MGGGVYVSGEMYANLSQKTKKTDNYSSQWCHFYLQPFNSIYNRGGDI